jgi:carboxylate-amine ligase
MRITADHAAAEDVTQDVFVHLWQHPDRYDPHRGALRSGYASYRTLIWRRWPTTGASAGFSSAADYDQTVADLVRSGVVTDPGMIYFDVRPSAHLPTVELRICDACPRLQDVVLLAGLFRALVIRETGAAVAGRAPLPVRPELLEAATWRAARSGLEGDLANPATAAPVPGRQLIRHLLADLRPALQSTGDWDQVTGLTESALARGSSAARQRAAYARGGFRQVVDTLMEEPAPAPTGSSARGPSAPEAAPCWADSSAAACSVHEAAAITGLSRDLFYDLVKRRSTARTFRGGQLTCHCALDLRFRFSPVGVVWRS